MNPEPGFLFCVRVLFYGRVCVMKSSEHREVRRDEEKAHFVPAAQLYPVHCPLTAKQLHSPQCLFAPFVFFFLGLSC